jgi:hypothetical protein
MVDGPAIVGCSSDDGSSSGISSKPGEQGLVLGDGHFGLLLASSLALSSQCS